MDPQNRMDMYKWKLNRNIQLSFFVLPENNIWAHLGGDPTMGPSWFPMIPKGPHLGPKGPPGPKGPIWRPKADQMGVCGRSPQKRGPWTLLGTLAAIPIGSVVGSFLCLSFASHAESCDKTIAPWFFQCLQRWLSSFAYRSNQLQAHGFAGERHL